MLLQSILKYTGLAIAGILGILLLVVAVSIAPVDHTPVAQLESYQTMMGRLDSIHIDFPRAVQGWSVGFGKVNITPREPLATAGYGKRRGKPYRVVHDSIYVRSLVIDNGTHRAAIVSADLLIIPPTVTEALKGKLASAGFSLDNTYLGATHTHNSIGHWGQGATKVIYGPYDDSVVEFIADAIVRSIADAAKTVRPATLKAGAIAIPQAVENRLVDGGREDPFLRVLEAHRSDSSKLVLLTYPAHATCLSQGTMALSRDYPGGVVDELETKDYDFAMFMAGAVGSHKGSSPDDDWECIRWMTEHISHAFLEQRHTLQVVADSTLGMARVKLSLSDPQVKVSKNWKVRGWLFRTAFGEYDAFLTVLRMGNVLMLGTPCDFSGAFNAPLDSLARRLSAQVIVTSFNGGYIGYLTPAALYDIDHYETRLMNWYAPGTGDYVRECLEKLMVAASDTR